MQFRDDAHPIAVYQRTRDDGFAEFRGVTCVRSTLAGFLALFTDEARMPAWMYRTRQVIRLAQPSARRIHAHVINDLPWPMLDRDAALVVDIEQDADTLELTVTARSERGLHPEARDIVRMHPVHAVWSVEPVASGWVRVAFQGYGNPGGSLTLPPFDWFYRLAVAEAPLRTLRGLRDLIGEARYQAASYPFIQEPEAASSGRSAPSRPCDLDV